MKFNYLNHIRSFFSGFISFWRIEDRQQNAPLIVEDAAGQTTFDFYDLHHLYNKCVESFATQADEQFSAIVNVALQKAISLDQAFEIRSRRSPRRSSPVLNPETKTKNIPLPAIGPP